MSNQLIKDRVKAAELVQELRGWAKMKQAEPIFDCLVEAADTIESLLDSSIDAHAPGITSSDLSLLFSPSAQRILEQSIETIAERGQRRDSGSERSMERIVKVFHALTDHHMTETEGWVFMVVLKLCRERTGQDVDNWIDGAAYMALAAESVAKSKRR